MQTYLLTWNPDQWHWWSDLSESFEKRGRFWYGNWSTGRNKSIQRGARLFLARVGCEPRGIVASGNATSEVYEGAHWARDRGRGRKGLYVDLRLDVLLNPAAERILDKGILHQGALRRMNWTPRASGVQIPEDVSVALEREWSRLTSHGAEPRAVAEPRAIEGLRTETITYVRGRSRRLRDLALESAGGVCEACGTNFAQVLGGKGVRVLQVHHRKQLSAESAPRLTSLRDLAVLCANCHLLVHMDPGKAIPVNELKRRLRRRAV